MTDNIGWQHYAARTVDTQQKLLAVADCHGSARHVYANIDRRKHTLSWPAVPESNIFNSSRCVLRMSAQPSCGP